MHGGGAAALRAHRSDLAISHRIIVLSRLARWEGLRSASPARAIFTAAGTLPEGAARILDFSRPVAVMPIAVMHLISDRDDPGGIIGQLMAAVCAGSYLALSQVASDIEAEQMAEARRRYNRLARETQRHRSHAEVTRFFDGLELLDPGVVPVQRWRPASATEAGARSAMWGGVARKPPG
jgi:S-adenosyl methyltransferase